MKDLVNIHGDIISVGDVVRIRPESQWNRDVSQGSFPGINSDMRKYVGNVFQVGSINSLARVYYHWYWHVDWLEPVDGCKIPDVTPEDLDTMF